MSAAPDERALLLQQERKRAFVRGSRHLRHGPGGEGVVKNRVMGLRPDAAVRRLEMRLRLGTLDRPTSWPPQAEQEMVIGGVKGYGAVRAVVDDWVSVQRPVGREQVVGLFQQEIGCVGRRPGNRDGVAGGSH